MDRRSALLALSAPLVLAVQTDADSQPPLTDHPPGRGGLLFLGLIGGRGVDATLLSRLPSSVRPAYTAALARRLRLRPLQTSPEDDDKQMRMARLDLRAALIAMSSRSAAREATAYASEAVLWWEWEGIPEGPLVEARYAEGHLQRQRLSPLRPFLSLFLMHRYRAAFECACEQLVQRSSDAMRQRSLTRERDFARHGYLTARASAQVAEPLVAAMAEDIDLGTFVYIEGHPHPGGR
ncbi:MAG TPA: hypothetical protein VMF13_18175 [Luteitalea sp.]|nr:hypothetical protein [Luteitalea sp.]